MALPDFDQFSLNSIFKGLRGEGLLSIPIFKRITYCLYNSLLSESKHILKIISFDQKEKILFPYACGFR